MAYDYGMLYHEYPSLTLALVLPPIPIISSASPNSFLLHRPYIRLEELPLFDTLFTGVQMGGGGQRGGLVVAGADPASASKARMWMLRALRDGVQDNTVLSYTVTVHVFSSRVS